LLFSVEKNISILFLFQDFDGAFVQAMALVLKEFEDRVRYYAEGNFSVGCLSVSTLL
jgi:hypothetical protein